MIDNRFSHRIASHFCTVALRVPLSNSDAAFSLSLLRLFHSWDRNHAMFSYHLHDFFDLH